MGDSERDLVILVPDRTFRLVVSALLRRHESLQIRPVSLDIQTHAYFVSVADSCSDKRPACRGAGKPASGTLAATSQSGSRRFGTFRNRNYFDAGCFRNCHEFLKPFLPTHSRALVLFDKHGCGRETIPTDDLEREVQERLSRSGWERRAGVVVVDPELEVWVWSDSPEVERCLGWVGRQPPLRERLRQKGLWQPGSAKPTDPKAAMALALREAGIAPARPVFEQLAASVGLRRCTDRAFVRLREILRQWFPAKSGQTE